MDDSAPSIGVKSLSRSRPAENEALEPENEDPAPEGGALDSSKRELLKNWREHIEAALEFLVLENIAAAIEIGMRKLVLMGYNAEESLRTIFKCSGECKSVSRIVDNAVDFLASGGTVSDVGEQELEEFPMLVLGEMLSALRQLQPSLCKGDALWEVLVSDLDISSCIEPIQEAKVEEDEEEKYRVEEEEATSDPSNNDGTREKLEARSRDSHSIDEEVTVDPEHVRNRKALQLVQHVFERLKLSDSLLLDLDTRVKDLESEVETRTEWAHAKVLQAAQRLSKDFNELKKLRADHEETLHMKSALRESIAQLDQTKTRLESLEAENAAMRAELEASKLYAAESIASSLEVSKQEKSLLKKSQAWEKQRAKLQEELAAEKRKSALLQEQINQIKESHHQAEVRSRQDSKAKHEALSLLEFEKVKREKAEVSARQRVKAIQRNSEADLQAHRLQIHKLEQELCKLRFGNAGLGISEENSSGVDDSNASSVIRNRECVMCLCEERSVVFLPCAHQVLCGLCNDLHERNGMSECPSCRTKIRERIRVFGGAS